MSTEIVYLNYPPDFGERCDKPDYVPPSPEEAIEWFKANSADVNLVSAWTAAGGAILGFRAPTNESRESWLANRNREPEAIAMALAEFGERYPNAFMPASVIWYYITNGVDPTKLPEDEVGYIASLWKQRSAI